MMLPDLALKLRQPAKYFSPLKSIRLGFYYPEIEKGSPLIPRIIKGCFVLDLLSSFVSNKSSLHIVGETYRTVDVWINVTIKPTNYFFDFLQTSFGDFRARSEYGCESHSSYSYGHFAITNINSLLRGFSGAEIEAISVFDSGEPLVARCDFSQFSHKAKESRVVASLYNFF